MIKILMMVAWMKIYHIEHRTHPFLLMLVLSPNREHLRIKDTTLPGSFGNKLKTDLVCRKFYHRVKRAVNLYFQESAKKCYDVLMNIQIRERE
ncbi:hypothetical protein BK138_07580 [Paenibacillus rhizosphaerae]|uniref:Uncharacterized protein n=1 Tax=Paenibacillus rhizosphaerae TaxID=297318 RepID=A0A1R1F2S0_9BACL|nr:hypothetical protein BK138_07580 [Paenibacillus rhizosphaerae]OXL82893.1 hypothetical protein BCV73_07155 [Paenibacillus sp. SSG-1]